MGNVCNLLNKGFLLKLKNNSLNLEKKEQIKETETKLILLLEKELVEPFLVVSENRIDNSKREKVYSPFVLSLIGLFLFELQENNKIKSLCTKIYEKIINTVNIEGIYNFYGNSDYYYDLDTTAVTNSFIYKYSKVIKSKDTILSSLFEKQNEPGGISTWINREDNNLDWFVNLNIYTFLKSLGIKNDKLFSYLKKNSKEFFVKGSQNYTNTLFPTFFICFYYNSGFLSKSDFNRFINLNLLNNGSQNTNEILSLGINLLLEKNLNSLPNNYIDALCNNWQEEICYFNSSKANYTSRLLNITVALYLLKNLRSKLCLM